MEVVLKELEKFVRKPAQRKKVKGLFINNRYCSKSGSIIDYYCLYGYKPINNYLRNRRFSPKENYKVRLLDIAFHKLSPLIEIPTLYRGINKSIVKGLIVGDYFSDLAYMSSSTNYEVAKSFSDTNTILVLDLTETPLYVKYLGDFNRLNEEEYLIYRGLKFIVTKIEKNHIYLKSKIDYVYY